MDSKIWQMMLQQAHKIKRIDKNCQSSSDQITGIPEILTNCAIHVSKTLVRICS